MIPQFKNTQEALAFGRKYRNSRETITELKEERKKLENLVDKLISDGLEESALYLASGQCQFVREAYQEAEK